MKEVDVMGRSVRQPPPNGYPALIGKMTGNAGGFWGAGGVRFWSGGFVLTVVERLRMLVRDEKEGESHGALS
jgi:hypothetical protein